MISSANSASASLYEFDAVVHRFPLDATDHRWEERRCLYAYVAPASSEILYVGKAWGVTVRGRWQYSAKDHFWNDLERDRGILAHRAILGEVVLPPGKRLSPKLLSDIESLLIHRIKPWGNIQSRSSRISRPGFVVACRGSWPNSKSMFHDAG